MRRLLSSASVLAALFIEVLAPTLACAQRGDVVAIEQRFIRLFNAGDFPAAAVEAQKMLAAAKAQSGTQHQNYGAALDHLGAIHRVQGQLDQAEEYYKQAIPTLESALGANHQFVAASVEGLGRVDAAQGRYGEAEPLYQRALAIRGRVLGANHVLVGRTYNALGILYLLQGRLREAEICSRRAVTILERGPPDRTFAMSLHGLATVFGEQGRNSEAEGLFNRSLAVLEKTVGANHPDVAVVASDFASSLRLTDGRNKDVEALLKRALTIREKLPGASQHSLGGILNNLADLYRSEGRHDEAEPLYKRALAIQEKTGGANHPDIATVLDGLGRVHEQQGRHDEAELAYRRAIAIREQVFGPGHPNQVLYFLADLYARRGDLGNALACARRGTAAAVAHVAAEASGQQQRQASGARDTHRSIFYQSHVSIVAAVARADVESEPALAREALEVAQRAVQSSAALALAQMAARFASGASPLVGLVRKRQDLAVLWYDQDKMLLAVLSKPDAQRDRTVVDALRRRLAETEKELAAVGARLETEFPDYAALASPKPLAAEEVQRLLGAEEALLFWLAAEEKSYVFALTRDGFEWKTIPLGREALEQKVAAFRRGLDVDAVRRGLFRTDCTQAQAERRGLSRTACGEAVARECDEAAERGLVRAECSPKPDAARRLFDLGVAHELYAALVSPVEALIKDKRHLIVVPSGTLTALPFHLLVTEKPAVSVPQVNAPRDLAAYRNAQWLLKRHAVSVLPSVASLKALRAFARKDEAKNPLVGFGDPVFGTETEPETLVGARHASPLPQRTAQAVATRSYSEFWQGIGVDRAQLRRAARLPETAAELQAVAKNLGAPASDIHLRLAASEATVKRLPLADYRVVYFATHGLVAGEVKGLGEPSLLLTLPKEPSETDDGLLTASEVAQLKLNADWVVLSACNTIAGDKPGAEALSGLARAFFYAGARALLVSHWAVDTNAATALTTSTFDILKADPSLGRAEALRRAMLGTMNEASNPYKAYPAYWAPFVVVGEGAAR